MGEWQPIDTAPKKGRVLICGGTYFFSDETFRDEKPYHGVTIANWNDTRSQWDGDALAHDECCVHTPTHWMPLPQPKTDATNRSASSNA